jgi:tetratricopeptide (TPR) repeat protein
MAAASLPPATEPMRGRIPSYDDLGDSNLRPFDEDDVAYAVPRNRRVGGWVVAAIVLTGASGLGYYAFRPYLATLSHASTATRVLDPRATQFLNDGERALGDGNLDVAKENFDKASALAEKDSRVLLDLTRLAAARADIPWLRIRLLAPDAADDIAAAKQGLDELSSTARKTADLAQVAAPDDPAAIRAKVDALRIAGDRDGARGMVAKIIGSAAQPETAYVLAALDLAELDPLWPTILDRLRLAAAGEGNAGRARAALVYALARSGDATNAKAELDKLAALTRPHPLTGALRAFLARGVAAHASADGGAGKAPSSVDVASLPVARPAGAVAAPAGGVGPAAGGGAIPGDPRVILEQAEKAKNRGDYDRAKLLYEAALAKSPGDSQALAGLGDAARGQHDEGSAKGFYQRALASNPNYLPALIGLADVELEEGDQPRAQKAYKDIVDRFPEGSYPARVKQRSESSSSPPSTATAPAAGTGTTKEVPLPANTPSDLPGTPP